MKIYWKKYYVIALYCKMRVQLLSFYFVCNYCIRIMFYYIVLFDSVPYIDLIVRRYA